MVKNNKFYQMGVSRDIAPGSNEFSIEAALPRHNQRNGPLFKAGFVWSRLNRSLVLLRLGPCIDWML